MAYGSQDWIARTDILLQTLSELIIRPKYGTRGVSEYTNYVSPSTDTLLGTISGKGVIYGGSIIGVGVATCAGDSFGSEIDGGTSYFTPTLLQGITFNLVTPHGATYHLECYDDINFYYAIALSFGITFETSINLYYREAAGRTPLVSKKIMYAVI